MEGLIPMEIKRLSPMAYRLHDFVLQNCLGEANAMKAQELAFTMGLSSTRELRALRAEVNSAISELHKRILTTNKGYFIAAADDATKAYDQYREAAWRKIKTGVSLIQEGKRLLAAINEDGQVPLEIGKLTPKEVWVDQLSPEALEILRGIKK
jgi:ElaB/YqjD/DUF883 family membrane-anchored ribosome-binding protein